MEKILLNAVRRTVTGKQVGALRRQGKLPGVLYGHNFPSTPVEMDLREATLGLTGQSSSRIITIGLEGVEHATLVREKQRDFIRGTLKHVDFLVISLTEKIRTKVAILVHGISPAVKDLNGLIVNGLSELEVECLPTVLPDHIDVDLSGLAAIGDSIHVRDIVMDDNITILQNPDDMIAIVTTQKAEEEPEPVVAEVAAVEEPEVIEKGKKPEDEIPEKE
jgi:large subunit ribosomal protein L25